MINSIGNSPSLEALGVNARVQKPAALNTIVTACDASYFLGAFLMVASMRYSGSALPVIVALHGASQEHVTYLTQFSGVEVVAVDMPAPHLNKGVALAMASTSYVTWLDADCLYVGNVDDLLIPVAGALQIRFRGLNENASVFARRMKPGDVMGLVPTAVLAQWRRDVREREKPRYHTQCVTNAFCFEKSCLPFLEKWQWQMGQLIRHDEGVINSASNAYFMTDESVLASLMCFCDEAPSVAPYRLNVKNGPHLMHFGLRPKPWESWRLEHFGYYDYVQDILKWVLDSGYSLPLLPAALQAENRASQHAVAKARHLWEVSRRTIRTILSLR